MQWNSQSFSFIICCFLSLSCGPLGFIWCYRSSDYLWERFLGEFHDHCITRMIFSLLLSWITFITAFIPRILKTGDIPNMGMGWRNLRKLFWFAPALGALSLKYLRHEVYVLWRVPSPSFIKTELPPSTWFIVSCIDH